MNLQEVVSMFLDSRKHAEGGGKRVCSKSTLEIYKRNLKEFTNYASELDDPVIEYTQLKRYHVRSFCRFLDGKVEKGTWRKSSKIQVLGTLRTFFKWIDRDEECQERGLKGLQQYLPFIEAKDARDDIPEAAVLKTFRNSFVTSTKNGMRNYVVTCLLTETGMRSGEVSWLRVDQVSLKERELIVPDEGKTRMRRVPLSTELVRLLTMWVKKRKEWSTAAEFFFPSKYGPRMTPEAIRKMYAKHRKKYKLPRVTAHTFRHAFCTNWLKKGGDLDKLKMVTGHTTYAMLDKYVKKAQIGTDVMKKQADMVSVLKED